jgi:beta-lactamase regulating signal transducer with metallopeptidase domain
VLLPRWVLALPDKQRRYIVLHEQEHRSAHDAQLLFATSLLLILAPWHLALWWQLRRLTLAVEMDCDNRVVATLGNAPVYGNLLLTVAQATSHTSRLQPGFTGGKGILERRLTSLLAPRKLPRFLQYVLPIVAIGLLFAVLSAPHPVLGSSSDKTSTHHAQQR